MTIEKNPNPGGHFEATSLTALPIQPIYQENGPNGLNWQCCLAGSSKTAPRILIFSMTMGADYLFEVNFIDIYAPQLIGHNKLLCQLVGLLGSNGFQLK